MSEKTAAELAAENDELREQLRERTRRDAAEKAGLPGEASRWIGGDTPEEAEDDARLLAQQLGGTPAPASGRRETRSTAQALGEKNSENRELAEYMTGNARPADGGDQ